MCFSSLLRSLLSASHKQAQRKALKQCLLKHLPSEIIIASRCGCDVRDEMRWECFYYFFELKVPSSSSLHAKLEIVSNINSTRNVKVNSHLYTTTDFTSFLNFSCISSSRRRFQQQQWSNFAFVVAWIVIKKFQKLVYHVSKV